MSKSVSLSRKQSADYLNISCFVNQLMANTGETLNPGIIASCPSLDIVLSVEEKGSKVKNDFRRSQHCELCSRLSSTENRYHGLWFLVTSHASIPCRNLSMRWREWRTWRQVSFPRYMFWIHFPRILLLRSLETKCSLKTTAWKCGLGWSLTT